MNLKPFNLEPSTSNHNLETSNPEPCSMKQVCLKLDRQVSDLDDVREVTPSTFSLRGTVNLSLPTSGFGETLKLPTSGKVPHGKVECLYPGLYPSTFGVLSISTFLLRGPSGLYFAP